MPLIYPFYSHSVQPTHTNIFQQLNTQSCTGNTGIHTAYNCSKRC